MPELLFRASSDDLDIGHPHGQNLLLGSVPVRTRHLGRLARWGDWLSCDRAEARLRRGPARPFGGVMVQAAGYACPGVGEGAASDCPAAAADAAFYLCHQKLKEASSRDSEINRSIYFRAAPGMGLIGSDHDRHRDRVGTVHAGPGHQNSPRQNQNLPRWFKPIGSVRAPQKIRYFRKSASVGVLIASVRIT